jgi:NAD(P)H-dependent FMN reductase
MLNIAIIIGSTRPNRVGESVGRWVFEQAQKRDDAKFELIDLKEINLPLLDEPIPPSMGQYSKPHTKKWSEIVARFDAYIFVTPEYNHSIGGALKNAIDFLYKEWNNKVAGFVGYGSAGAVRAVEQLRLVMAECQVATVREQVMLSLRTDFVNYKEFKPESFHLKKLDSVFDQVIEWGEVMKETRPGASVPYNGKNSVQEENSSPSIH